jgi:hypothetical protein
MKMKFPIKVVRDEKDVLKRAELAIQYLEDHMMRGIEDLTVYIREGFELQRGTIQQVREIVQ